MHLPNRVALDSASARNSAILLMVIAMSIWSLISAPAARAATPKPVQLTVQQACASADYVLIGARGSGDSSNDRYGGLGNVVYSAYQYLTDKLGSRGASIAAVPVTYPAQAVESLALTLTGNNAYFNGLSQGVNDLRQSLKTFETWAGCRGKYLVLIGYSQGAMVVNRVLQEPNKNRAVFHSANILIGNGDRYSDDGTRLVGNAGSKTRGIGFTFPPMSGTKAITLRNTDVVATNVCVDGDIVCAPRLNTIQPPWWCKAALNQACSAFWSVIAGADLARQVKLHLSSYAGSSLLRQAIDSEVDYP